MILPGHSAPRLRTISQRMPLYHFQWETSKINIEGTSGDLERTLLEPVVVWILLEQKCPLFVVVNGLRSQSYWIMKLEKLWLSLVRPFKKIFLLHFLLCLFLNLSLLWKVLHMLPFSSPLSPSTPVSTLIRKRTFLWLDFPFPLPPTPAIAQHLHSTI